VPLEEATALNLTRDNKVNHSNVSEERYSTAEFENLMLWLIDYQLSLFNIRDCHCLYLDLVTVSPVLVVFLSFSGIIP
jgi:hypothetical protein